MFTILLYGLFIVQGGSMEHKGYNDGDYIKTIYAPCFKGSIIAFEYEDERYIKRLMFYGKDGCVYVKGRDGTWFDNGKEVQSLDSRIWGCIDVDIIGCVI